MPPVVEIPQDLVEEFARGKGVAGCARSDH